MTLLNNLIKTFIRKVSKYSRNNCCRCITCLKELSNGIGLIKCVACGSFQPAPPTTAEPICCPDYYRLLVPEAFKHPQFKIDLRRLKGEYLKLQSMVHPDRQGVLGESWSSWINRAHETLKNPLQRAIYLVNLYEKELSGSSVNDDVEAIDKNIDDLHDISLVLEIREELDSTSDPKVLQEIRAENDEKIRNCCEELAEIFKYKGDVINTDLILVRAKRCINKLRYWISIDRQLKEKEQ